MKNQCSWCGKQSQYSILINKRLTHKHKKGHTRISLTSISQTDGHTDRHSKNNNLPTLLTNGILWGKTQITYCIFSLCQEKWLSLLFKHVLYIRFPDLRMTMIRATSSENILLGFPGQRPTQIWLYSQRKFAIGLKLRI